MNVNDKILVIILSAIYLPIFSYEFYFYFKNIQKPTFNFKKFLRYNIIVLLVLSMFFLVINHTNYLDYEAPIPYKKIDKISFENFRGVEFVRKSLYGNEHFAYVVTSIDYHIDDNHVNIESFFHPSRSFVYNKNTNSKDLLSHELYHFKITEFFARKAKKQISETKDITENQIESIIDNSKNEESQYQAEYDSETFHSYVYEKQKKYEHKIDSLLFLFKNYSNPKVIINEKK